jgi:hypothetical protein
MSMQLSYKDIARGNIYLELTCLSLYKDNNIL